jgi:DNA-binding transcriptional LysR family regulator
MPSLPDFEAWAIFAKVAEWGSFSRAAEDLKMSKATVSKVLTRLERRLGAPLLHRSSRRLSLTDSGRSALDRAARLLADGEAMESDVTDRTAEPRGTVRVTAPISFGIQNLGAILPEFLARYPQVAIDLQLSDHTVDLVAGGIDIALRIGVLEDSALRARRLFAIRRPLVASPDYVEIHGRPSHPADLERHQAIIFTHLTAPAIWQFHHPLEGDCSVRVNGRLHLDSGDVAVQALVAGVGLAIPPEFLVWRELREGRLVELLPEWAAAPVALFLVTPPGAVRPTRVRVLIDFLVRHFREVPWAHAGGDNAG